MSRFTWLRRIATELPHNIELAYCLLRDPRVPSRNKAALAAGLALIVSPLDIPAWVPVVGEADILLLTLLATGLFVDAAPAEVVEEQRRLIERHQSRFDADAAGAQRLAASVAKRIRRHRPEQAVADTATASAAGQPAAPQHDSNGQIASAATGVST